MTKTSASLHAAGPFTICAPEARKFILIAAILASALGFIDGSMVAIALPAMRDALDASLPQAQWVSNAYMLTISALILVGGAFGDRYGLVRVFGSGVILFVAASMLCAAATSPEVLIGARALQGIGAAFMIPGSLALISRAYPEEERGKAIGIWAAASAVTAALGPIIGGLVITFGESEAWRWIFGINLPLGAVILLLLWLKVDQDPAQSDRGIDIPGALCATLGLGLIALALSGGEHGNYLSPTAKIVLAGGFGVMLLFLLVEYRSPHPMMPLGLFRNAGFSIANLVCFFVYFAFGAIMMYLPMALVGGWGITELETAAAYAPLSIFIASLSGLSGKLASRFGPAPLLVSGCLVLATGYALMGWIMPTEEFWTGIMPAMCMMGLGMALVVAPLSTAVMGSVPSHRTGIASGVNNAITRMASLMAVSLMGSLAALAYVDAGGDRSYGEIATGAAHLAASNAGFAKVAYTAAALCLLAAFISLFSGRMRPLDDREKPDELTSVIS